MRELSINEMRMVSGGSISSFFSSENVDSTPLKEAAENTVIEGGKYLGSLIGDKIGGCIGSDFGELLRKAGSKTGDVLGGLINNKIFA